MPNEKIIMLKRTINASILIDSTRLYYACLKIGVVSLYWNTYTI